MLDDFDLHSFMILLGFIAILLFLLWIKMLLLGRETGPQQMVRIGNGQSIGRRAEQDDYFSTAVTAHGTIAVLADGISGLTNGRLASTIAVNTFINEFTHLDGRMDVAGFFGRAAKHSNTEIIRRFRGATGGTTLVAAIIQGDLLYWGAVGDSLLSIYRNGELHVMNQKHTLETVLTERYLAGEVTRDEAIHSPIRNQLINYLGYEGFKSMEICQEPFRLRRRDLVILTSDGVYNTLTEVELERILAKGLSPHDAAEEIIGAVERKRLKYQDNATIIIMEPIR
ncbi:PP2C family protein-serine/threonine phosphatase [Brevibacillus dissolubilis]|uniref:PP2C family protein-serine/threonine phosphatase n=1 Tax=Brevibacillus dissolubilis TaxID=1844116 RepID=UPI0011164C1D|nr:protein phosphatase 2C domain-containing protein [Brevibacillus dissolubilis]